MAAKAKKFIEECKDTKNNELEIVDKGINTLEIPGLCMFTCTATPSYVRRTTNPRIGVSLTVKILKIMFKRYIKPLKL